MMYILKVNYKLKILGKIYNETTMKNYEFTFNDDISIAILKNNKKT